jgi:hypothetical protein
VISLGKLSCLSRSCSRAFARLYAVCLSEPPRSLGIMFEKARRNISDHTSGKPLCAHGGQTGPKARHRQLSAQAPLQTRLVQQCNILAAAAEAMGLRCCAATALLVLCASKSSALLTHTLPGQQRHSATLRTPCSTCQASYRCRQRQLTMSKKPADSKIARKHAKNHARIQQV